MKIKYCALLQDYKSCCKNISILPEFIENKKSCINKCEWNMFFQMSLLAMLFKWYYIYNWSYTMYYQ